jgi:hypothetical protein
MEMAASRFLIILVFSFGTSFGQSVKIVLTLEISLIAWSR